MVSLRMITARRVDKMVAILGHDLPRRLDSFSSRSNVYVIYGV